MRSPAVDSTASIVNALGPGHDPGRENEQVKVLRGQQYGDTLSLTHQAQVRFDEFDPRHVGIAKGLADDHNVRAARGDETAEGAPDAAGSADDRNLHSLKIEARSIDAPPCEILVPLHDGHTLSRATRVSCLLRLDTWSRAASHSLSVPVMCFVIALHGEYRLRKMIRWDAIENGQDSQNDLKQSGRNAH